MRSPVFIDHISLDRAVSSATPALIRDPNSCPDFGYSPETGFPREAGEIFKKYEGKFKKTAVFYARRTGLNEDELFLVVQLGAVRAAKTYDRSQAAFWTYAQWQIRAHVNDYVKRNVPSQPTVSLNTPIGDEDGSATLGDVMQADPFGDYIGDKGARRVVGGTRQGFENYAEDILIEAIDSTTVRARRRALLRQALATLSDRERAIVEARHGEGDPAPLSTFADRFGISVERVRQIEAKALDKVGKHIRGNTACSRSNAEATRLPPPKDELVTRHQPAGTVKVPARNVVVGTFCFSDAIPGEFDAPMRAQIARTQKRAQAEQAERRSWRMRAVAAGLSWAVTP